MSQAATRIPLPDQANSVLPRRCPRPPFPARATFLARKARPLLASPRRSPHWSPSECTRVAARAMRRCLRPEGALSPGRTPSKRDCSQSPPCLRLMRRPASDRTCQTRARGDECVRQQGPLTCPLGGCIMRGTQGVEARTAAGVRAAAAYCVQLEPLFFRSIVNFEVVNWCSRFSISSPFSRPEILSRWSLLCWSHSISLRLRARTCASQFEPEGSPEL